jgi:hypothetical protein
VQEIKNKEKKIKKIERNQARAPGLVRPLFLLLKIYKNDKLSDTLMKILHAPAFELTTPFLGQAC